MPQPTTDGDPRQSHTPDHESSLYHVFVAFGFAGAEVGVVLGRPIVAAVGLSLFGWSLAELLGETSLADTSDGGRRLAVVAGLYAVVAGSLLWVVHPAGDTLEVRGLAFVVAAVALLARAGYDTLRTTAPAVSPQQ